MRLVEPGPLATAILWAILGSAVIGASFGYVWVMRAEVWITSPSQVALDVALIAGLSLVVIAPCTLAVGLMSAVLINLWTLGRWSSLVLTVGTSALVQIAYFRLMLWDSKWIPEILLLTAPFAISTAIILWWRLTRTA